MCLLEASTKQVTVPRAQLEISTWAVNETSSLVCQNIYSIAITFNCSGISNDILTLLHRTVTKKSVQSCPNSIYVCRSPNHGREQTTSTRMLPNEMCVLAKALLSYNPTELCVLSPGSSFDDCSLIKLIGFDFTAQNFSKNSPVCLCFLSSFLAFAIGLL